MKKSIFLFFAAILCSMSIDAYAATQRYIYVGLSNNYHKWKDASQWGINHWGGTGGGVVPGSKITDLKTTFTHSGCTFHMYRMYVYDDNKNFEFKGSDSWWDCKKENISISGTTKNALLFRDNDGGDGGSPTFYQTNYQEESAVSLSASSNSVSVGEEVTLTPKLTSNAEYNEIASTTYSVGTGATVSDGKFVATAAGTYTVTATITYNPKKFTGITKKVENITCEIVVSEVAIPHPVTGVTVAPTSVTIKQGATTTLTATVSPSNADDPSITWSSDNTSVATVVNGVVTAVAAGTANITVTTVDGGFTATCAVKVKPLQYTFYAINSAEWPTVAAHYWEGADGGSTWPGANMVKESETINSFDIYSITISSDFVNIMFTNQINGDNNKKTADLTTEGNNGKYYDIKDAKWYASLSEVPVSYDYYVIGTINSWGLKDAAYGLELNEDVYEKEVALAIGKHELKINNGTWDNASTFGYDNLSVAYEEVSRGSGEGDNNIVIDLAEATTITVKLDKNTKKITLDGLTEKAPEPTYDYYLTGSLVGGWDVKQQGIEKDGELYKAIFSELPAGIYEFKITAGDWEHQWNYNNLGAAYEEVSQGVDGEGNPNGNIKIVTEEAKNITVIFDATAGKITFEGLTPYVAPLTYTVTVPAGTEKCYIAGAFAQSNWNTFLEMEQVTGEDKFTITITGAKESDEYKYACQADWAYVELNEDGSEKSNRTWAENDVVAKWAKPAVITYALMGVGSDWTTGITMTYDEENNQYVLTNQSISKATDAVKVAKLSDGSPVEWYNTVDSYSCAHEMVYDGFDSENIVLEDGTYDFYFKLSNNEIYIEKDPVTIDVTLSGMVATPYSRMGSYRFLSLDDEDGNQISIFNGTEGAYGNDFEVNAYLAAYDVTVVGTGDWNVVDGVETLTATLQVEDDNTTIYNVVATVGAATTIILECMDATYTITDPEFNEVTFTGVADGKEFTILVSYFGGEYYSEGEWGETFIMGTEVDFDDSDAEAYYLGGTYIDDASNTYEVAIFATPAVVEPTPDYTRTVTPSKYGTLCLPFGGTITGAVLYECVGSEPGKVYLASVTELEAGVPYIFQATATELAVYSDGTTAPAGSHNGLVGTFDDETPVAAGNYILLNNELRPSDGSAKVNANRAYIVMSEVPTGAPTQMPGRRYIGMSVQGENAETGLDNITNGENTTIKVIENGQLIIIRNGEKFNAQGVRF